MNVSKKTQNYLIQNQTFDSCIKVIYTASIVQVKIKDFLAGYDITYQQYKVLCLLHSTNEPMSTIHLRDKMMDKMSDTSRIVDRLILKKLVIKKTAITDKRKIEVKITESGIKLLSTINKSSNKLDDILKHVSKNELKALNNLLDKISKP